jgi:hypothetical protein
MAEPQTPEQELKQYKTAIKLSLAIMICLMIYIGFITYNYHQVSAVASGQYISVDKCKQLLTDNGATIDGAQPIFHNILNTTLNTSQDNKGASISSIS